MIFLHGFMRIQAVVSFSLSFSFLHHGPTERHHATGKFFPKLPTGFPQFVIRMSEEHSDAVLPPEGESEVYESILGDNNSSSFRRYAVPPQFEGNSSEDENGHHEDVEGEGKESFEENDDGQIDEVAEDSGYAPLIADEFGEFVSSEEFGDYYTPDNTVPLSVLAATEAGRPESKDSEPVVQSHPITGSTQPFPETVRISIPPLDASKPPIRRSWTFAGCTQLIQLACPC
jgi:hypothetical protein